VGPQAGLVWGWLASDSIEGRRLGGAPPIIAARSPATAMPLLVDRPLTTRLQTVFDLKAAGGSGWKGEEPLRLGIWEELVAGLSPERCPAAPPGPAL